MGDVVFVCSYFCSLFVFFFFQAEDGIRDLVRSRGLGDVYKRQAQLHRFIIALAVEEPRERQHQRQLHQLRGLYLDDPEIDPASVSYTHLTLPTSDLV